VSASLDQIKQFHAQHKDIILKPLDGMGGTGVFRVRDDGMNLTACIETLTDAGLKPLMVQRYIPAVVSGDRRVLVVHGQVIPFVLARMPKKGETRANLAAGGTGVAQAISDRERAIAQAIVPSLLEGGIALAGLDVIGDYLTEINITSPTCLVEIKQQTGFDVAHQLMVHWSS
jgi:glutathione synthase